MKNLKPILFLSLLLSILAMPAFTHAESLQCDEFDFQRDCFTNDETDEDLSGFSTISGGTTIFYNYCSVNCSDGKTFRELKVGDSNSYGRDKNYLFYGRKRLDGIDPDHFQSKIIDKGDYYLVYDSDTIWLNGTRYDTFDPDTLEYVAFRSDTGLIYLKDENHVYRFKGSVDDYSLYPVILKGADPNYFGFGYNITNDAVYWYGKKIEEADVESFKVKLECSNTFATDKNNAYFEGQVIRDVDLKSFGKTVINEAGYCIDKNGFYGGDDGKRYLTIDYMKTKYPNDAKNIDQSIQTAIETYEEKYPGYTPQPAQPKPIFKDVPVNDYYYWSTKEAYDLGWIDGYPDGNFKPNKTVNRAEFAKMLALAFYMGQGDGWNLKKFPDVLMDQWYIPHLSMAVERGMMEGYPDGKMRPANNINRAEALKMTLELIGKKESNVPSGSQWYEKYRLYAEENFDLDFLSVEEMSEDMTRGECVELILEAIAD